MSSPRASRESEERRPSRTGLDDDPVAVEEQREARVDGVGRRGADRAARRAGRRPGGAARGDARRGGGEDGDERGGGHGVRVCGCEGTHPSRTASGVGRPSRASTRERADETRLPNHPLSDFPHGMPAKRNRAKQPSYWSISDRESNTFRQNKRWPSLRRRSFTHTRR